MSYSLESFINYCDGMMIADEGLKEIGSAIIRIFNKFCEFVKVKCQKIIEWFRVKFKHDVYIDITFCAIFHKSFNRDLILYQEECKKLCEACAKVSSLSKEHSLTMTDIDKINATLISGIKSLDIDMSAVGDYDGEHIDTFKNGNAKEKAEMKKYLKLITQREFYGYVNKIKKFGAISDNTSYKIKKMNIPDEYLAGIIGYREIIKFGTTVVAGYTKLLMMAVCDPSHTTDKLKENIEE